MAQLPFQGKGEPPWAIRDVWETKPTKRQEALDRMAEAFQKAGDGTWHPDGVEVRGILCKYAVRRHHQALRLYLYKLARDGGHL